MSECPEKSINGLYQSNILITRDASPNIINPLDNIHKKIFFIFIKLPP